MTGPRVYTGLSRREHPGWIAGLTPAQAATCLAVTAPVIAALATGALATAGILAGIAALVAALVVLPVRGHPALRWLVRWVLFQVGVARGWSRWQSAAALGETADLDVPDLPGVLARLDFPDGPQWRDRGRVCLIHDTAEGRWGATARLTHGGTAMLSPAQRDRLATGLGHLLLAVGHQDVIDRCTLLVRTVPDDGTDYQAWREAHTDPAAPALARAAADELDRTIGAVSVHQELFLTVSGPEDVLRRPATAAGGGVAGRGIVLYRALDSLDERLRGIGVRSVDWLSGTELAAAIHSGFNPAATETAQMHPVRWGMAGPTHTPSPRARSYTHDGYTTVSYSLATPDAGTMVGSLGPLLTPRTAGERRAVAIHYEVISRRRARTLTQTARFRTGVLRDWKRSRGFAASAATAQEATGARAQETAIAAGHGLIRFAVATAVTVPSSWPVEDYAARLEAAVAGRFVLQRLELAQDAGMVAAVLPLGIGIPRVRGGRR